MQRKAGRGRGRAREGQTEGSKLSTLSPSPMPDCHQGPASGTVPPKCPKPRGAWVERGCGLRASGVLPGLPLLCILFPDKQDLMVGAMGREANHLESWEGVVPRPPSHPQIPRTSPKSPASQLSEPTLEHTQLR